MKAYQTKSRIEITSGPQAIKLEIDLNHLDPLFPRDIRDVTIKSSELTYRTVRTGSWNVQAIRFEHNPDRELAYRNTKARLRDCYRRIKLLHQHISKEAFAAALRRYRQDFRYRKFDGTFRKDRILIPARSVSLLREIEKELRPSRYFAELAKVCRDKETREQYRVLAKYYSDHPEEDRAADKRRFIFRSYVVELQPNNETAQLLNNGSIIGYRLVPNFVSGIRRSYNWASLRRWWAGRVQRAQSQIGTQLRLRDYYRRYLERLSGTNRLENNQASQVSSVGLINPTTWLETWFGYRPGIGATPYLWDRSQIYLYGYHVQRPIVTRLASVYGATAEEPSDLAVYICKMSDIPEFRETPQQAPYFLDYTYLIRTRGITIGAAVLDETDAWKSSFPGCQTLSDLRDRLIFASADTGYIQYQSDHETVDGVPDRVKYVTYRNYASIERVLAGPDCSGESRERWLEGIRADVPIYTIQLGLDPTEAMRERLEISHARLRALDIPEHDKDAMFNLARSVGELKDLPETCKSLREVAAFLNGHATTTAYVAQARARSRDAVRLCLATSADHWSRTVRQGSRYGSSLGYRTITKTPVALLGYKQLCAAYLCWKFGVSQTLADAETLARRGVKYCSTVQRGLRLLASKLDQKLLVHNVSVAWSMPLDVNMPREKRSPRSKNGQRDFLPQAYTRSVLNVRERVQKTLTLSWSAGILAYVTGQLHDNLHYLTHGTPVIFDDQGYGFPMVPYGVNNVNDNTELRVLTEAAMRRMASSLNVRQRVFTSQSIRGKVYGRYSIAQLLKTVRKSGLMAKILGFHPAEVVWELAPCSFIVEWFTNLRSLVLVADRMIQRAASATVQPIGKTWAVAASRLWAGCPQYSGELRVKERFSEPIAKLTISTSTHSFQDSEHRIHTKRQELRTVEYYYSRRTLEFSYSEPLTYDVSMSKTGIRKFLRCPLNGKGSLPPFKLRCNLNLGKLTSLLAIITGK